MFNPKMVGDEAGNVALLVPLPQFSGGGDGAAIPSDPLYNILLRLLGGCETYAITVK